MMKGTQLLQELCCKLWPEAENVAKYLDKGYKVVNFMHGSASSFLKRDISQ